MMFRLIVTIAIGLPIVLASMPAAAGDDMEDELKATARSIWDQMHAEEAKPIDQKKRDKIFQLNQDLAGTLEALEKYQKDKAIASTPTGTGNR